MIHRLGGPVVLIAFVALSLPVSARAETFCVAKASCPQGGEVVAGPPTGATIQQAVTEASSPLHPGTDTILLGGVTFSEVNVVDGGTSVHFVGEGMGVTVLREEGGAGGTALSLTGSGDVNDLTVHLTQSGSTAVNTRETINRVEVTAEPAVTNALGIATQPAGSIGTEVKFSRVLLPVASGNIALRLVPTSQVSDSELQGFTGLLATDAGPGMRINRVVLRGRQGLTVEDGADLNVVFGALIQPVGSNAYGIAAIGAASSDTTSVTVRDLTIVGDGSPGTMGAWVSPTSFPASITLRNAVIDGVAITLRCLGGVGTGTIVTDWSSYDQALASPGTCSGTPITHGSNNVVPHVSPGFVDASAGNVHLRFDSPLIDRADPAGTGGLDTLGGTRVRDGDGDGAARQDIGALEYQRLPPTTSIQGPAAGFVGQSLLFTAAATDPDSGDVLSLVWSFDDGGTATGDSAEHAWATAGTRSATLNATDPTGLGATAVHTVDVTAPAPSGTPAPANTATTIAAGTADTVAPVISGLRLRPAVFRRGTRLPRLSQVRLVGTRISFSLSEAADVTLSFERSRKGRRVDGKCVRPRRAVRERPVCRRFVKVRTTVSRSGKAGPNRIRFDGRLVGSRRLRPGRYRLTVSASDAAGNAAIPARARFRLLPPLRRR